MLWRQPEYTFCDDVAQDLRRSALDRIALGSQVPVSGFTPGEVDGIRSTQCPVVVAQTGFAVQFEVESRNLLGQTGKRELHSRAFGAGLAGGELLAPSDRKSVVEGKSVSVGGDLGGRGN